jgi:transposase
MSHSLFLLTDEQWAEIEPILPIDVRSKALGGDRRVISGIVHVLKIGCRWCDWPAAYGPPTTIYNRFVHWAKRGVWERIFTARACRQFAAMGHGRLHRGPSADELTAFRGPG